MPVLMMINLKGGVAKTTTAIAVAECLATTNYRTLLIDADHQSMAGTLLLGEERQDRADDAGQTLHDMLSELYKTSAPDVNFGKFVVTKTSDIGGGLDNLSVVPCSFRLDDFYSNLKKGKHAPRTAEELRRVQSRGRNQLRRWLDANYDFVIIDAPPSLAPQVKFLLAITDGLVVPCVPDRLSIKGTKHLVSQVELKGFKVPPLGTVWSMHRTNVAAHARYIVAARAGAKELAAIPKPFEADIPHATAIVNTTEPGTKPKSFKAKYTTLFAEKFQALTDEIIHRVEVTLSTPESELVTLAAAPVAARRA